MHPNESRQNADRQHQDRHQRTAHMQQEYDADQRHDDAFLQQGLFQGINRTVNQFRAIIHRHHFRSRWQAGFQTLQFRFDLFNDIQRIFTAARHHNAGRHFPFAVQLGQTTPLIRCQFDLRQILHPDRRPIHGFHHQLTDIIQTAQITLRPHHKLGFRHLNDAATDILIVIADRLHDLQRRNVVGLQFARIEYHLILLHETADTGHFRHAGRCRERIAQRPVLQRTQCRQRLIFRHQRILVYPADPGSIRPQCRCDTSR